MPKANRRHLTCLTRSVTAPTTRLFPRDETARLCLQSFCNAYLAGSNGYSARLKHRLNVHAVLHFTPSSCSSRSQQRQRESTGPVHPTRGGDTYRHNVAPTTPGRSVDRPRTRPPRIGKERDVKDPEQLAVFDELGEGRETQSEPGGPGESGRVGTSQDRTRVCGWDPTRESLLEEWQVVGEDEKGCGA